MNGEDAAHWRALHPSEANASSRWQDRKTHDISHEWIQYHVACALVNEVHDMQSSTSSAAEPAAASTTLSSADVPKTVEALATSLHDQATRFCLPFGVSVSSVRCEQITGRVVSRFLAQLEIPELLLDVAAEGHGLPLLDAGVRDVIAHRRRVYASSHSFADILIAPRVPLAYEQFSGERAYRVPSDVMVSLSRVPLGNERVNERVRRGSMRGS